MTTRKLTPAEALECLRDWRSTTMSLMEHRRKWGQLELDGLFRIAIAALEEALAQKHPAAPVPSDEAITKAIDNAYHQCEIRQALRLLARRIGVQGVPQ